MPPFNAIQMGPHTMLDEGIERCLDLIQDTAAINALMVYSHTYHDDLKKPPAVLAADHGVPPRDMRNRKLPVPKRTLDRSLPPCGLKLLPVTPPLRRSGSHAYREPKSVFAFTTVSSLPP
jgi:hypothetical protein